jgi:molybdopterin synthase catalytic subunit
MAGKIHVSITDEKLDIGTAYDFVSDPEHGAVNSFIGAVRDFNLGKPVVGVSYDAHEVLAENVLQQLCEEVRDRFDGKINIYISHFKGRLDVKGISVVIAVSTPHRAESFEACRILIEELKSRAPVWKQEHYEDGNSEWVKGHALCQHGHDHENGHNHEHKKRA